MVLRLLQKNQQTVRQVARSFATGTKQAAEHHPQESFGTSAWRNTTIAVVAGLVWYRVDQHLTHSGDEKHPFTRWIEYHMTTKEQNDNINAAHLAGAEAAAEYKLFAQEAQRPLIYRMRYPESFERASARGLVTGLQADLSDLKVKKDNE
ncbi:hypothetical protein BY458DRAFT_125646 [Sporodiniella umbellata]|nr:hypothetical protein BY458DRAFT_125646 [Sporodiniella umbellata]